LGSNASPVPAERDVHVAVLLHGVRLDFAACLTAAVVFVRDVCASQWCEVVSVIADDPRGLPRLPNERLYLEPQLLEPRLTRTVT
jgi:hypothetical protein